VKSWRDCSSALEPHRRSDLMAAARGYRVVLCKPPDDVSLDPMFAE
jgi:hypothetical protein